jgi:hypothetical protein
MEKLKVALLKRIQQLVADWPEIIGMHGNSSARSVWAFLRGLKSGVREPPPHGKPFHLAVASSTPSYGVGLFRPISSRRHATCISALGLGSIVPLG